MEKESISTVKEITTSLNSALYKRITNPLIGSFILTWLVWNWKLLLYVFNLDPNISIPKHILFIQNSYLSNYWINIIWPLASALVITLGFPYLNIEITLRNEQENFEEVEKKYINEVEKYKSSTKICENEYYQVKDKNDKLIKTIQELLEMEKYYFSTLKLWQPDHDVEKFIFSDLGRFFLNIIYYYTNPTGYSEISRNTSKEIFDNYEKENRIAPLPGKTKIYDPDSTPIVGFYFTDEGWDLVRFYITSFSRLINIGYRPNLPYENIKSAKKYLQLF